MRGQGQDLPPQDESLTSQIAAKMTINWADLIDVGSAKLRRYGPVDPNLHRALDRDAARLADVALSIAALVRGTDTAEAHNEDGEIEHGNDGG